ncbi:hypothetical protein EB796_017839 [Bugula neritina]|uniref:Uncharacterized protein n=1 Tax=Bugula neritina TaxID=10212 RepID=A0A7J7JC70_BUGNE|nr:hypothetical protein EB796_017839 [Bugula neritina]
MTKKLDTATRELTFLNIQSHTSVNHPMQNSTDMTVMLFLRFTPNAYIVHVTDNTIQTFQNLRNNFAVNSGLEDNPKVND